MLVKSIQVFSFVSTTCSTQHLESYYMTRLRIHVVIVCRKNAPKHITSIQINGISLVRPDRPHHYTRFERP